MTSSALLIDALLGAFLLTINLVLAAIFEALYVHTRT
jgi:hypothetical protein